MLRVLFAASLLASSCHSAPYGVYDRMPELLFHDDFRCDLASQWTFEVGNGSANGEAGFGNNELQEYTKDAATLADGCLRITADRVGAKGFTSARLTTKESWAPASGGRLRVEAKIKMPVGGPGIWPAFWMLPAVDTYGVWPRSGEIDIVETSVDMSVALASTHFEKAPQYTVGWQAGLQPDFNVFSVDWTPYSLEFACNGEVYHMATANDWSSQGRPRPFDQAFRIKLNVAVGGSFPGDPTAATVFPQHMDVDWVRVWKI